MDLRGSQRGKSGRPEESDQGSFWRGTAIDIDSRLRVGRAIGKNEEEGCYSNDDTDQGSWESY